LITIMKCCRKCNQLLPINSFYRGRLDCKECYLKELRDNYDSDKAADKHLRSKYGISIAEYDQMLSNQNGVCAICKEYNVDRATHKRMPVDHCHTTGKVRGILCNRCNLILGKAKDNIELLTNAIHYLSK
jgi:hypothetical protein